MLFEPSEAQARVAALAREVARGVVAPAAREGDRTGRFPADVVREMGRVGLLGLSVPGDLGGAGAGAVAYALAVMEIAAADCSVAVTMAVTSMVGETIARFGTRAQALRCCPPLASGEWLAGAFALSEPQAGSDSGALATRAARHPGGWVIEGEKQWITNGDLAGVVVVWARTDPAAGTRGISAFLVEQGAPGLRVGRHERKMGLRASSTVSLAFEDCFVPDSALLGAPGDGFRIAMAALDGGRIGIAAQATGTIAAALEAAVAHARARRASGHAIGEIQAIELTLADTRTDHDAARLLTLRAAARKERALPFRREASMAKLFASEAAQRATARAVQIHGASGCTDAFPVERYLRDARVQTIYEGTSEIQRTVVARSLPGPE